LWTPHAPVGSRRRRPCADRRVDANEVASQRRASGNEVSRLNSVRVEVAGTATIEGAATSSGHFIVLPTEDFQLSVAPATVTLPATGQAALSVSVTGSGFTQLATLGLTGVPTGATAGFAAPTLTAGQSTLLTVQTTEWGTLHPDDLCSVVRSPSPCPANRASTPSALRPEPSVPLFARDLLPAPCTLSWCGGSSAPLAPFLSSSPQAVCATAQRCAQYRAEWDHLVPKSKKR
jgi:hypothetical protein